MEHVPNEILGYIFNYSTKRSIIECSKVCKKWYELVLGPQYYSTIDIYSVDQLKKFLLLAKENMDNTRFRNNNKPIGHYVHYLTIHMDHLSTEYVIDIIDTFPNIQDIQGLCHRQLRHITSFTSFYQSSTFYSFWYTRLNYQWMHSIKENITYLDFLIDDLPIIKKNEPMQQPQQQQQHNSSLSNQFNITIISEKKRKLLTFNDYRNAVHSDFSDHEVEVHPKFGFYNNKIITLPLLKHLVTLKLEFNDVESDEESIYEFDERTFESIHESCPYLEHLEMKEFNMNASEAIDSILMKLKNETKLIHENTLSSSSSTTNYLAIHLKQFHLITGVIHDPKCYIYLLNKYPQLTTLNLQLIWTHFQHSFNHSFKLALFDLISQSPYLTSLTFQLRCFDDYINQIEVNEHYWPTIEFSHWIKYHSHQLKTLNIPYDITTINEQKMITLNEGEEEEEKRRTQVISNDHWLTQTNYLKHLKRLSFSITKSVQQSYSYLILNNKREMVSLSLEELEINSRRCRMDDKESFYIYHWLDAFPNLLKLTLNNMHKIKDIPSNTTRRRSTRNQFDLYHVLQTDMIYVKNEKMNELRKKGRSINDNTFNKNKKKDEKEQYQRTYKLKALHIKNSTIYFKHGFSSFSQRCPHIHQLDLQCIHYAMVQWELSDYQERVSEAITRYQGRISKELFEQSKKKKKEKGLPNEYPILETTFDLTRMDHLNYLCLSQFKYIPWLGINHDDQPMVEKLIIHESTFHKKKFNAIHQLPFPNGTFLTCQQYDGRGHPCTLNILCQSTFSIKFTS